MLIEPAWGPCPATECPYKAFIGHCGLTACIRPELRPHNTIQFNRTLTQEELEMLLRKSNSEPPQPPGFIYRTRVGGSTYEDDRPVSEDNPGAAPVEED